MKELAELHCIVLALELCLVMSIFFRNKKCEIQVKLEILHINLQIVQMLQLINIQSVKDYYKKANNNG